MFSSCSLPRGHTARYARFIRGLAGFLLFCLLQIPLPAYSLTSLQACGDIRNASVCADLFGVKSKLITGQPASTNAVAKLIGRVGGKAVEIANLDVGAALGSKAGLTFAAAGVAGVGAAALWGVSYSGIESLRSEAYDLFCSVNVCSVLGGFSWVDLGNGKSKLHYLGDSYGTIETEYFNPPPSLFVANLNNVPYVWTSSGTSIRLSTGLPFTWGNRAWLPYDPALDSSIDSWDDLSDFQKAAAIDLLAPDSLAGALQGQSVALPAGYESFDLELGDAVGSFGDTSGAGDAAASDAPKDSTGGQDKAWDKNGDGGIDKDFNGDGVIDDADKQAALDLEDAKEAEDAASDEAVKDDLSDLLFEASSCDDSTALIPYAICKLNRKFPFDFIGSFAPPVGSSVCPEFSFYGQSLAFCWLNDFFNIIKWVIWIAFSVQAAFNL